MARVVVLNLIPVLGGKVFSLSSLNVILVLGLSLSCFLYMLRIFPPYPVILRVNIINWCSGSILEVSPSSVHTRTFFPVNLGFSFTGQANLVRYPFAKGGVVGLYSELVH